MQSSEIKKIIKKYHDVFEALENYDKTGELPSIRTINKLKNIKEKTRKAISQIIEEKI